MPYRPSYVTPDLLEVASKARGQQQLDDAISTLKAPSLLDDAVSGIHDIYQRAAQTFTPLPIVVSDRPDAARIAQQQPRPQSAAPAPQPMPSTPTTSETPSTPKFSTGDFTFQDGRSEYRPPMQPGETVGPVTMTSGPRPAKAAGGYAPSSGQGDPNVEQWSPIISEAAREYNVPESAIKGFIEIESGGNPDAVSAVGAQSLMQVMPFHFQPGENPKDPRTNIFRGAKVYADALARYGDPDKAAAAYFGAIDNQGNITGATDATGTDGHAYVAKWRAATAKYGGSPNAGAASSPAPAPSPPSPTAAAASSPAPSAAGTPVTVRDQWNNTWTTTQDALDRRPGGYSDLTILSGPMQKTGADLPDDGMSAGDQKRAKMAAMGAGQPADEPPQDTSGTNRGRIIWQDPDNPQAMPGSVYRNGVGPEGLPGYGVGERDPIGYRGYNPAGDAEVPQGYPQLDIPYDDRPPNEQPYSSVDADGLDTSNHGMMPWPANPGMWKPGQTPYGSDPDVAYRMPLYPTDPEASTSQEYDLRDADQGAREAGYTDPSGGSPGSAGSMPVPGLPETWTQPGTPTGEGLGDPSYQYSNGGDPTPSAQFTEVPTQRTQYDTQIVDGRTAPPTPNGDWRELAQQPSSYNDPTVGGTQSQPLPSQAVAQASDQPQIAQQSFTPPSSGLQAVYDAAGKFLHWIQGGAQVASDVIAPAARRAADAGMESATAPTTVANALPSLRGVQIVQDTIQAFGDEAGRRVATELGIPDEELANVFGHPVTTHDVAGFVGSNVLDPTNYIGAGEAKTAARGLEEGAQSLGSRVRGALDANAERVAAADARIAEDGSTVAPGMLGATPNGPQQQTVEVLQQRLQQARSIVDRVLGTGDPERLALAQENRAAIESQLADAQNARRSLEPRIKSDVGTRLEQTTPSESSVENVMDARFPPRDGKMDPGDLSGPVSIPTDTGSRLNASAGPQAASADRLGQVATDAGNAVRGAMTGGVVAGVTDPGSPQGEDESDSDYAARRAREVIQRVGTGALIGGAGFAAGGRLLPRGESGALQMVGPQGNQPPNVPGLNPGAALRLQAQMARRAQASTPPNLLELAQAYRNSFGLLGNFAGGLVNALGGPVEMAFGLPTEAIRTGVIKGYPAPVVYQAASIAAAFKDAAGAFLNTAAGRISPAARAAPDFRPPLSERMQGTVGKAAGYVIDAPGRVISQAPDAAWSAVFERWGRARTASEIMTENGISRLDPAGQIQEINRLLTNPTTAEAKRIDDGAKAFAQENTYKGDAGYVEKTLGSIFRPGNRTTTAADPTAAQVHDLLGSFVMPFYASLFKIQKLAASRVPIVGMAANRELPMSEKIARQAVGLGFGIWAADRAAQGLVTGPGPDDPDEKARLQAKGWAEWSTYVPGIGYVPSNYFGSAGPSLKAIGGYYDAQRYATPAQKADAVKMGDATVKGILRSVEDFPVVQAFQSVYKMAQQPIEGVTDLGINVASQFVPALVRAKEAAADPYQRRVDPTASQMTQIGQKALNRVGSIPGLGSRQDLPPALDRKGEPVPNPRQGWGAVLPRVSPDKPGDPLADEMGRYGVNLDRPRDRFTFTRAGADAPDGAEGTVPVMLTPDQQQAWLKFRWQNIQQQAPAIQGDPRYAQAADGARQKVWQNVLTAAETYADRALKAQIGRPALEDMIRGAPAAAPVRRAS